MERVLVGFKETNKDLVDNGQPLAEAADGMQGLKTWRVSR